MCLTDIENYIDSGSSGAWTSVLSANRMRPFALREFHDSGRLGPKVAPEPIPTRHSPTANRNPCWSLAYMALESIES
jgi:hypothetical protein